MSKVVPAMFPLFGVPIGMFIGGEFGHIAAGAAIGGGVGFIFGAGILVWLLMKPNA